MDIYGVFLSYYSEQKRNVLTPTAVIPIKEEGAKVSCFFIALEALVKVLVLSS